jgi:hypothetical protein
LAAATHDDFDSTTQQSGMGFPPTSFEAAAPPRVPITRNGRVAIMQGFWGQNIGNAFFDLGGRWIAQQVFGADEVSPIQNQQGYRTFHRQRTGNPKNDLGLLRYLDTEVFITQGPMFTNTFESLWRSSFEHMKKRGIKVALLSAAFFKYSDEEVNAVRRFLKEFPPAIIVTRDSDTYDRVKDLCKYTYSGIDSAFFVPNDYRPVRTTLPPYIAVNFDQYPEPNLTACAPNEDLAGTYDVTFQALNRKWGAKQPWLQNSFSAAGQWQCYLGAMLDFRRLPKQIDDYIIVRPDHRFNPHVTWKIYKHPNGIAADEPYTYLTIYSGAEMTLSDRVHACVATLAYGKPAMLFHPTPRARLFERLGLAAIRQTPVSLSLERLEEERQAEVAFLRHAVSQVM